MTKWEYERIDLNTLARNETDIDLLNEAGAQGWELIAINTCNVAILKRAIATTATRAPRASSSSASNTGSGTGTGSSTKPQPK